MPKRVHDAARGSTFCLRKEGRGISAQNYMNISRGSPGAPRSSVPSTQTRGSKLTESAVTYPDAKRYGLAAKNLAQRLAVANPMGVAIR